MSETEIDHGAPSPIQSRTTRFAEWLMKREEQRAAKETNLEGLIKLNVLVSFLTLGLVGGFTAVQTAVSMIPYL